MAACPNCGRQTLRTKDWACQWCGYPLISRAYKLIDKTFKELQEERSLGSAPVDADTDDEPQEDNEFEEEVEPEPEPEPERKRKPESKRKSEPTPPPPPKPKFRFFRKVEPTQRPAPETRREPEREDSEDVSYPPPRPVTRPAPRPEPPPPVQRTAPPPVYRPEPKPELPPAATPAPAPRVEIVPQPQNLPQPVPELKPVTPVPQPAASAPPPAPAPEPVPAKPQIVVEPPTPYIPSLKMDDIKEGMEITTDDLDALFKADKSGINLKLNGKTVILKGTVEKVFIRDHLDIRYIVVTGKRKVVWSARCTFEKDDAGKASRLNEGVEVAVRGKYDGYGKNIIFKNCQIV
jgi:hypothetical protein